MKMVPYWKSEPRVIRSIFFLATAIKTEQITLGSEVRDEYWHFLSISYDENASDDNELKVYLDGKLLASTGNFGGALKVQHDSHKWTLGTASPQNPSLGRFIGKIDDLRIYNLELSESLHTSTYNNGFGDLSLTIELDYNGSSSQNPIFANLNFKRYGNDWPVDFNASRIEFEKTSEVLVSGSGSRWTLEFNSTIDRGRMTLRLLKGAGVDSTGLESQPVSFQIGFGRPIVALEHLTAWWTFDEGNGTEVHDYFGNFIGLFDGISDARPNFDPAHSKFGSSLYFPQNAWVATDAYAAELGIDGSNPRTVSFWMYTQDHGLSGNDQYQPGPYGIGRRYWSDNSNHGIWAIRGFWDTGNYRRFHSQHWGHDPQVFIAEGVKNKWVHIAHQYNSDNTILVYVNGTLRLSNTKKGMDTQNYFPLQIGRWTEETTGWVINGNGIHKRSYKGWIDDFRVYDEALSESEILAIYGSGNGDFKLVASLEIDSIVDGDPTMGRIRFTRNQANVSDLDLNLSSDLVMTGGAIDPDSLVWDDLDGSFTFDYSVDPALTDPSVIEQLNPTMFPGLSLWLDANDSSTILSGVAQWQDRSGNNRHANVSIGSPVYNQSGGPNGMPIIEIRRSGGNDALSIEGSAFFAKEHYYVFRSSTPNKFDYFGGILGHSSSRGSNYLFENNQNYFHGNQSPASVSQNGLDLTGNFALSNVDSFMVLRVEVNNAETGPYSNYRIGTTNEGANWCTSTDIAEVIAFENTLSTENREKMEGYLAHKWGLASSLSVGHAYLGAPPNSWNPSDVSPALWLDANETSTVQTTPHWLDKSEVQAYGYRLWFPDRGSWGIEWNASNAI